MRKQRCAPCYTVAVVTERHCFIRAKLYVFCRPLPQVTPTSDTDEFLFHSMLVGEFSSVRHFFCVPVCDLFYYSVISSKMATFFLACVDSHSWSNFFPQTVIFGSRLFTNEVSYWVLKDFWPLKCWLHLCGLKDLNLNRTVGLTGGLCPQAVPGTMVAFSSWHKSTLSWHILHIVP